MLTIAIAQLSRVNPMNIAQRSWVRHRLPFSCHWAQYFFCHTEVLCNVFSWRNCNCSIGSHSWSLLFIGKSTQIKVWEWAGWGDGVWASTLNITKECAHPNGGFWDLSFWVEVLGLGLTLAPSEVNTSSDAVLLAQEYSWLLRRVCFEVWGIPSAITACG